jgi:chromosomal replication initiator protein
MNQLAEIDGVRPVLPQRRPTVADVQAAVAVHYGLTSAQLRGADRKRRVAWPRQMAMLLARDITKMSLPEIGRRFGGRDHSTVVHACRAVAARLSDYPDLSAHFDALTSILTPSDRAEFFRRDTLYGRFSSVRGGVSP